MTIALGLVILSAAVLYIRLHITRRRPRIGREAEPEYRDWQWPQRKAGPRDRERLP